MNKTELIAIIAKGANVSTKRAKEILENYLFIHDMNKSKVRAKSAKIFVKVDTKVKADSHTSLQPVQQKTIGIKTKKVVAKHPAKKVAVKSRKGGNTSTGPREK
jgi:hypothetical protein